MTPKLGDLIDPIITIMDTNGVLFIRSGEVSTHSDSQLLNGRNKHYNGIMWKMMMGIGNEIEAGLGKCCPFVPPSAAHLTKLCPLPHL